jgi:hypothetical protein
VSPNIQCCGLLTGTGALKTLKAKTRTTRFETCMVAIFDELKYFFDIVVLKSGKRDVLSRILCPMHTTRETVHPKLLGQFKSIEIQ